MKMPECDVPFGAVQTPPALGVPPNWANKLTFDPPAQLETDAEVPAFGITGGGGTTVMNAELLTTLAIGHALSVAVTRIFAGENAGSGVQQMVATAGFVPTTVNVEPGS
jgi:hypothetical protein